MIPAVSEWHQAGLLYTKPELCQCVPSSLHIALTSRNLAAEQMPAQSQEPHRVQRHRQRLAKVTSAGTLNGRTFSKNVFLPSSSSDFTVEGARQLRQQWGGIAHYGWCWRESHSYLCMCVHYSLLDPYPPFPLQHVHSLLICHPEVGSGLVNGPGMMTHSCGWSTVPLPSSHVTHTCVHTCTSTHTGLINWTASRDRSSECDKHWSCGVQLILLIDVLQPPCHCFQMISLVWTLKGQSTAKPQR